MDQPLQALLDELEEFGRANDAAQADRADKMLNLAPETAHLLSLLVRSSRRRVLEIGTSNGYSTIWLAWAVGQAGGRVTTIDRSAAKQALAEANLRRAGLRDVVELRCGDATAVASGLSGPFDCVFFDADRTSAPAQLELLMPKLAPDVLLCADNALSHPGEIAAYLDTVRALPGFDHLIIPVGKGLSVAYRAGSISPWPA